MPSLAEIRTEFQQDEREMAERGGLLPQFATQSLKSDFPLLAMTVRLYGAPLDFNEASDGLTFVW